jgi:hypothetical protein
MLTTIKQWLPAIAFYSMGAIPAGLVIALLSR